jgi:hypothetical protein
VEGSRFPHFLSFNNPSFHFPLNQTCHKYIRQDILASYNLILISSYYVPYWANDYSNADWVDLIEIERVPSKLLIQSLNKKKKSEIFLLAVHVSFFVPNPVFASKQVQFHHCNRVCFKSTS